MPELARRQYDRQQYRINQYDSVHNVGNVKIVKESLNSKHKVNTQKVQRNYLIHRIVSIAVISLFGFTILPYGFNKVTKMMFNPTPYKNIKTDYHQLLFPTSEYLSNNWFLGERSLEGAEVKKPEMAPLVQGTEMTGLEDQIKNLASLYPSIHPSVYVWDYETGNYADINADGTLSTTPPAANGETSNDNKKVCGTAMPTFYGGFTNNLTWKNWELDVLFTFSCGGKMINATRSSLLTYTTENAYNLSKDILRMWQVPGQQTDIPKLNHASIVGSYDYSLGITTTRFLEDSSYLRLKSLQLTYNVPQSFLQKIKIFNQFKVYAAMTNVFTVTGYSGIDPEVSAFGSSAIYAGYDYLTMPQSRSYQFGIRASF